MVERASNVVDLAAERDARTPHMRGRTTCLVCGHQDDAIAPAGVTELQCGLCGTMRARWQFPVEPMAGVTIWKCGCEGRLFYLLPGGAPMCATCGTAAVGWDE